MIGVREGNKTLSTERPLAEEQGTDHAREAERREFDAVTAALTNSSRLLRLFLYIGEKYFQGQTERLHEYDIATEVFGRSKSTFNPGEDAIVRVEAHRLRKRLKEYYEGEGRDHPVQVSLPPGSYVPAFTHCSLDLEESEQSEQQELSPSAPPAPKPHRWVYFAAACTLLLIAGAGWIVVSRHGKRTPPHARAKSAVSTTPASATGPFATVPLHILAGDSGKPQLDNSGTLWQPDHYAHYGGKWTRPAGFIGRTSDPLLYEHWRNGDFTYDIPLKPGQYELHLYFLDQRSKATAPSTFSVAANGKPLLSSFDIYTDAPGLNMADERIFRNIGPGPDGILHLDFTSLMGTAELNAISILPGLPNAQLPIRIVTQPGSYTDPSGHFWRPDDYYLGGYESDKNDAVTGTADPNLYAGERFGNFSYSIPVVPGDSYTLILHFAELYFGPSAPGGGGTGSRVFRVLCNGQTLLDNFDIYKQVGSFHALTETFHHLTPSAQGKLNITFQPIVNNATVSAIEVIDESQ
jgi:hypothetical protein